MRRRSKSTWSKGGLIAYYVGILLFFIATFFLPVIGNPDTTMGRNDVVYGYEAAELSWSLLFNSYEDVYEALVPSEAVRDAVSDKTIIATLMLYGSSLDEPGSKGIAGAWSKLLVQAYSICLQFAWLSNAIPILLLVQVIFRFEEGPWRTLLIYSSRFLCIFACSFLVLPLLAWSWPTLISPGASGYFFWVFSLFLLSPFDGEQRLAWPYS